MSPESTWPTFLPAANRLNPDGEPRRFGFEIEFHGIEVDAAARAMSEVLGTELEARSHYEFEAETELGVFALERDVTWLKEVGRREAAGEELGVLDRLKQAAGTMAEKFMPLEVVAPPLRYDQLSVLDDLTDRLAQAGATGTSAEDYYAFGVHVNPEIWFTETDALLRSMQAFAILQRQLVVDLDVDLARRIAPFITP